MCLCVRGVSIFERPFFSWKSAFNGRCSKGVGFLCALIYDDAYAMMVPPPAGQELLFVLSHQQQRHNSSKWRTDRLQQTHAVICIFSWQSKNAFVGDNKWNKKRYWVRVLPIFQCVFNSFVPFFCFRFLRILYLVFCLLYFCAYFCIWCCLFLFLFLFRTFYVCANVFGFRFFLNPFIAWHLQERRQGSVFQAPRGDVGKSRAQWREDGRPVWRASARG